jgi:alanyl-tRNA synthetase
VPGTAQIRQQFIDFFAKKHGHAFVPSSPVVPHEDPTLLFTNAGMNQFKDVFLGQGRRPYRRAVNSQKCIRAGGKHNDLEDVGRDHYHHTFFEMLGNWSFGDYFKAEAIEWAWTLLTAAPPAGYGLDPRRLHVTVFAGDDSDGLEPDEESARLWRRHVEPAHIGRFGRKDNFWEMGETGPCGPCSEIHYDFTPDRSGGRLVNAGDARVMEVWNLVFIQFNRGADGTLTTLPAKHVDTGMGLERLSRVLQHKESNYDIDAFAPILGAIERHTGAHPYGGSLEDPVDTAYRVIADHVRCLTVAVSDGAWPGNEGRGFVLRRILRRAVRHAHQTLRVPGPLLCDLVPAVVDTLGGAFPELRANPGRVASVLRDEEESFLRTLDRGLALFEQAVAGGGGVLPADDAFKLHDTYGFPIDLTRVMAAERGIAVDEQGFERLMEEARERSRGAGGEKESWALPPDVLARLRHLGAAPTHDEEKHAARPVDCKVLAVWNGRDLDETAHPGRRVAVILNRTNHYAESGGQIGDEGTIEAGGEPGAEAWRFAVQDTVASGGYVLHVGRVTEGLARVGDCAIAMVDRPRRDAIRANHTATHLLNHALREVVGPEEDQRGSHVGPERLRFDFAAPRAMSDGEVAQAEEMVNARIAQRLPVRAAVMPLATARSIAGVRAIFGEKYPDPVRVVGAGVNLDEVTADPGNDRWRAYSIELCGGTHLGDTSQAQRFVIVQEQALAAGVRRITAVTGAAALAASRAGDGLLERAARAEGLEGETLAAEFDEIGSLAGTMGIGAAARARVAERLEALRPRVKAARKEAEGRSRAGILDEARRIAAAAQGPVIVEGLPTADREGLLGAMDAIRARHAGAAILLIGSDKNEARVTIVARVPDPMVQKGLRAGDWVREPARLCGGSGGGRPDMAQAGGKLPEMIPQALAQAREFARSAVR